MFDFFVKKTEVVLECFTFDVNAYNLFQIDYGSNYVPKWWRTIKNNDLQPNEFVGAVPRPNMRGCAGFIEYFQRGLILPLWSDLIIETDFESFRYQFSDCTSVIDTHSSEQSGNNFTFYHHLKLKSPWFLKCKEEIHFLLSSPCWNFLKDEDVMSNFFIVPGVVEFKHQRGSNINVFVTRKENRFEFSSGTPLGHLYPNSEKKIILKRFLVSEEEYKKLNNSNRFSFSHEYYKKLNLLKQTLKSH